MNPEELVPVASIDEIPRDTVVYAIVEQDAERLVRTPTGTARADMRTAVIFVKDPEGELRYTVVTLGPATGRAPLIYTGGEVARYLDASAWSKEEGSAERSTDREMTKQWHETIADAAESAVKAEQAISQFGPGGHVQRE